MNRNTDAANHSGNMGWVCPVCGKPNVSTAKFCSGCGTALQMQNTGYVSRNTGMYGREMYGDTDVYYAESPKRKSGALKIIALALGCIVLAVGIGFGVSHFLLSDDDTKSSDNDKDTEQVTEDEERSEPANNPPEEEHEQTVEEQATSVSGFEVGGTYTVISPQGVKVRSTPEKIGATDNQLRREQLPSNYYSQSEKATYACLVNGTQVRCLEMNGAWMKIIEGGWICTNDNGEPLVR